MTVDLDPGTRMHSGAEINAMARRAIAPVGTTAGRPASPVAGQQYYDTDIGAPIWFDGADWKNAMGAHV